MQTFRVDSMTCGHCASTITKAVRAVDPNAQVEVNLAQHLVRISSTEASGADLSQAIAEAGYVPVPMEQEARAVPRASNAGCCGCCGVTKPVAMPGASTPL